ncbi:MAG: bifunctional 2-polyprenyl-6-hydroxyphenol methylase/3-demethylubiquinol 3-O-methyltransferase UbiG [Candidatus Symbiodolus clandestinus]
MITSLNLNPNELAQFDRLAKSWWDPQGEMQLLHRMNLRRLEYILQQTNGVFGKQLLDVGCGGGLLSESLAIEGAQVTGIDMSSALLDVAQQHAAAQGLTIDYQQSTVEDYAKAHPQRYDIVTCLELLEHVPDPASVVRACGQLVKPPGYVFFSTLNRTLSAWLLAIVVAESIGRLLPQGTHQLAQFIRPSELCSWLPAASLVERHIIGLQYQPLCRQFRFSRQVAVNYILLAQRY